MKEKIIIGFSKLIIFREILKTKTIKKLIKLVKYNSNDETITTSLYYDFLNELYNHNDNIGDYLLEYIFRDDNIYIKKILSKQNINKNIENALKEELDFFSYLSEINLSDIYNNLAELETKKIDFYNIYSAHIKEISKKGYGIFYNSNMFTLDEKNNITKAKHQDNQNIKQLYGYEREREKVIQNTKTLLEGKKANNILLYGDAGTGKSSTIKAVANMFRDEGLRLIEVKKNQLSFITDIIQKLSSSPLKFIIFIDDLTFSSNDDSFSYLKAVLEGGVNSFPQNIVVYVTSNYRHLIKENFNDRTGDDIHVEDTIQQIMSLTNRFGIVITFQRPDRDLFVDIVLSYAKDNNIQIDKEELIKQAESYAIRSAGRSPRVAKQFIETLIL
ncbi:ATP-binding protein [Brachyspira pilosicoli]|uniref:ATP-binding protein n=1 Tax=Brachyspira pilosicoli TaxID=52584 RepID=UPI003004AF00